MARPQIILQLLRDSAHRSRTHLRGRGSEIGSLLRSLRIRRGSSNIKVIRFEVLLLFQVKCTWPMIALISEVLLRYGLVMVQLSLRFAAILKIVPLDSVAQLLGSPLHFRILAHLLLVVRVERSRFLLSVKMNLAQVYISFAGRHLFFVRIAQVVYAVRRAARLHLIHTLVRLSGNSGARAHLKISGLGLGS
jgi:hypothetical protein